MESFHNGKWGTLCNIGWTRSDATTVCHELGFGTLIDLRPHGFYGESNGRFWFHSLSSVDVTRSCNHRQRYSELNVRCANLSGTYVILSPCT